MSCEGCPYKGSKYVGPEGPSYAKIAIVGEAPGAEEERLGRPFVGPSWDKILFGLLQRAGIERNECYITNVLKCRPPANNIDTVDAHAAISHCKVLLEEELKRLKPNVIVPVGATAQAALGITGPVHSVRGAIHKWNNIKVIPTYHPASFLHQGFDNYITCQYDWRKIKRNSGYSYDLNLPEKFNTFPTIEQIELYCDDIVSDHISVAVDIETYYTDNYWQTAIKTIAIAKSSTDCLVVPFINEAGNWVMSDAEMERAIFAIGRVLEDTTVEKVMHNALFDICVLLNHGWEVGGPIYDTMLAHRLVYFFLPHDLGYVATIYTDYPAWKLIEKEGDDLEFRKYNARDAVVLHMVRPPLDKDLDSYGLHSLFETTMESILPIAHTTTAGILIDMDKKQDIVEQLEKDIKAHREELERLSGVPGFNPLSPVQVSALLFDKWSLRSTVKTKGGQLSVNEEVIKRLGLRYPENEFIPKFVEYKRITGLRKFCDPPTAPDGRVHSQFKLSVVSGRLASEDPNVQQLPGKKKDSQGYVRGLFVAARDKVLVATDYSQLELRLFAQLADDKEWLGLFAHGEDIHSANCKVFFGELTPELRLYAKNFIFGFIYGSEGKGIERVLPSSVLQRISVEQIIHNLKMAHPTMFIFRENLEREMRDKKKIVNPFGRIQWYVNPPTKENLREAFNFPIQSTGADIYLRKYPKIHKELRDGEYIVLPKHDEFILEVPEQNVDKCVKMLREVMEEPETAPNGMVFKMPCEVSVGPNMGQLKEVK